MMRKSSRLQVLAATLAMVAFVGPGCDDKRRHGTGQEVTFGEVDAPIGAEATPLEVGQAFLAAVRDAQRTRAGGLGDARAKDAYDNAIARMQSLAARKEICEQVRGSGSPTIPPDVSDAAALTLVCESWISMVAHYVEGFELERLTDITENPTDYATVYLQAANPAEQRRVAELRGAINGADAAAEVKIRETLLAEGINPRTDVGIEIRLKHIDEVWRVLSVTIGPGPTMTWPPRRQTSQSAGS
jgi:hypothetical protein